MTAIESILAEAQSLRVPARAQRASPRALPESLRDAQRAMEERALGHPFLEHCARGSVGMAQLRRFLVQHGKYAAYFTRFLCAVISQLPESDQVRRLAGNLAEELGFGETRGVPHAQIYDEMLRGFGIALDAEPVYAETRHLIDTMFMLCRQPGGVAGLGALCLGAEALVPAVYARIVQGFRRHGVPPERLEFFYIHISCDDDHAATMVEILDGYCAGSPLHKLSAITAGDIAVGARMRLFDALLESRSDAEERRA
jgi:pyrroloquinoline-quinone synthase